MNTETTDNNAKQPAAGWICYDGECAFCLRWVRRIEPPLRLRGFGFVPLQTQWVKNRLCIADVALLEEMKLLLPDQQVIGGANSWVILARHIWWLWPLWFVSHIPGAMPFIRACYRFIARNRHCSTDGCAINNRKTP